MADLLVELYGVEVGKLSGSWRTFDFIASPQAIETFGIDSPVLSVAIPLAAVPTRARKDRRQNYFRELLPEGRMLSHLAQQAGLGEQDVIGLLRRYGRDVGGALQVWDPEVPGEPRQPALAPLETSDVAALLENVQNNPLGNKPTGGKTSLAGVQDKIVLARTNSGWNRALDGHPSSHILKPEPSDHPTVIYDEEYGARLARATGLSSFRTWIDTFDSTPALVIERYDRTPDGRVHQEDFNQVLGAAGNQKYQQFGGRVSLSRIARVLSTFTGAESLEQLLRMTVVAVAVGNLDMHGKNLSLLHPRDAPMSLAPAYDVVPQSHQANDGEMALAVDQVYRHAAITRSNLIAEGTTWGISAPAQIVDDTLTALLEAAKFETPHPRAHPHLVEDIIRFTSNLIAGRAAGDR